MNVEELLRWWRNLWRRPAAPDRHRSRHDRHARRPVRGRRRSSPTTPPAGSRRAAGTRPRPPTTTRSARPTSVPCSQALRGGALRRDELGARVGAADWGPGRLDAVVAYGVASGVLVETDGGAVKARYVDD